MPSRRRTRSSVSPSRTVNRLENAAAGGGAGHVEGGGRFAPSPRADASRALPLRHTAPWRDELVSVYTTVRVCARSGPPIIILLLATCSSRLRIFALGGTTSVHLRASQSRQGWRRSCRAPSSEPSARPQPRRCAAEGASWAGWRRRLPLRHHVQPLAPHRHDRHDRHGAHCEPMCAPPPREALGP